MSRAFDVAVFYAVPPSAVYQLTLVDFLLWESQAWRIVREREAQAGE